MDHRIAWRSRPRSDYPWPLRVKRVTTAELADLKNTEEANFIGPLSMQAVSELVYRVKKLRFEGLFEADHEFSPLSIPLDVELPLVDIADEAARFVDCAYHFDGNETYSQPFRDGPVDGEYSIMEVITTDDNGTGYDFTGYDVLHDTELNEFHLNGIIGFYIIDPVPILFVMNRFLTPISEWSTIFTCDLVLACGTFQTQMVADWAGGYTPTLSSLTITPIEYFPFKTTAGDPAWDTTTGAPANGGPGA